MFLPPRRQPDDDPESCLGYQVHGTRVGTVREYARVSFVSQHVEIRILHDMFIFGQHPAGRGEENRG